MTRLVEAVTVPAGDAVLDLLPNLAAALSGQGPALLPVGADDPRAGQIAERLGAGSPLGAAEDDADDPTALVMPTSGSTGLPKGVLLSAGQLASSAAATESRLGGPGSWLLALPAHHIAGMQVLLRAARAGSEPVVMPGGVPFTAAGLLAASLRLAGGRQYVSLVPTQLARVLADPAIAAEIASMYDAILVGGSATAPALLTAAREAGLPVVTTYGMTETCGGCVYDGAPLPGVRASVGVGDALVLTGPMVARGYRGRAEHPAFAIRGSFVTADIGSVTAGPDGSQHVVVTGRVDDVIVTGGVKVAPGAVEAAIRALPGIADVVVVGVPDERWGQAVAAVIVPTTGRRWTVASLRDALVELPRHHRPHHLRTVRQLDLLPSGKPDRAAARAAFA